MNGLDLFSGIGGLSLALNEWVRPIAYCEIDPYCQGVLLSRQASGDIQRAPIWDDVRTFPTKGLREFVDVVYAGFPCQDISIAGNGKGLEGKRSGLFFEIMRLAKEIKPPFIFLENVPAITKRGGLDVVRSIAEMGYDCRWCVISAASVGARHKRERWFLLAHANSNSEGLQGFGHRTITMGKEKSRIINSSANVSDTRCECERGEKKPKWPSFHFSGCERYWEIEPELGRLANGISHRMDKLRALGNAVVPKQAKEAFKILMGLKNVKKFDAPPHSCEGTENFKNDKFVENGS